MAEAVFHIEVVTPEKVVYSSEATSVVAPGNLGSFGVLAHHLPMVVQLGVGKLEIRETGGREVLMALQGGFFEVSENRVIVLADTAERADEIDVERAKRALERAQNALSDLDNHSIDRERARAALARAEARYQVASDGRNH